MDTAHSGDLVNQPDPTEVLPSVRAKHTARVFPSDQSIHTDHHSPSDHADQTVQSDHPDRTARAADRITPRTSKLELRPEPRPDDGTERPTGAISRPTHQTKTNSQARINLGREDSIDGHSFSLMARFVRTACPEGCPDVLASVTDPMKDFSILYFTKAWKLSCLKTCPMPAHMLFMKTNRQFMWNVRCVCGTSRVYPYPSQHEPARPDAQTDRPIGVLSRPYRRTKADSRTRYDLGRVKPQSVQRCSSISPRMAICASCALPPCTHLVRRTWTVAEGAHGPVNKKFRALTRSSQKLISHVLFLHISVF